MSLSACATNTRAIDTYCLNDDILYLSNNDVLTEQTILGIIEHNEKFEALCG